MNIPTRPKGKQGYVVSSLSELALQSARSGIRQRQYALVLNPTSYARLAPFYAYRIGTNGATPDCENNLWFAALKAHKNTIWFRLVSLRENRQFCNTVSFLKTALKMAKSL